MIGSVLLIVFIVCGLGAGEIRSSRTLRWVAYAIAVATYIALLILAAKGANR
jgi:bacteriorhodopsin